MSNETIMWLIFVCTGVLLFLIDIKVSTRRAHEITKKQALLLCTFWILIASVFGILISFMLGGEKATEFFTGYLIEYTLSMDNMFVFLMIFSYFSIPKKYQPTILTWGILGAVTMRLIFIFIGIELLNLFHWIIYVFGGLLIFTAIKMLYQSDEHTDPGKNPVIKFLGKFIPFETSIETPHFFVNKNKTWHATPLFAALLAVETSDVIFAIDSIPAILAISRDKFIVYTSNVFAVIGLRSLYFFLASITHYFRFLKTGISIILIYVGFKMMFSNFIKIPPVLSLGIVFSIIAISILLSIVKK